VLQRPVSLWLHSVAGSTPRLGLDKATRPSETSHPAKLFAVWQGLELVAFGVSALSILINRRHPRVFALSSPFVNTEPA